MARIKEQQYQTKTGKPFVIRTLREEDAQQLLKYVKVHGFGRKFSITAADEFNVTVEQEQKWIHTMQNHPGDLGIVAELNGEIIGMLDFHQKRPQRLKHHGSFGMSVHSEFRDQHVGRSLLQTLIEWAVEHEELEQIHLGVLAVNSRAIHLYKKMGFKEFSTHAQFIKNSDGTYIDEIAMFCKLTKATSGEN